MKDLIYLLTLAVGLAAAPELEARGNIVVANRASGDLSVIDVKTHDVMTVAMPAGDDPAEPMYVVYSPAMNRVFVGDRANNRVVVLNARDFSFEDEVSTGNGVFHMWAASASGQLWVVNDIDDTVTVIDTITLEVLETVALPADLVGGPGKPHDVIVDPTAPAAFVTILAGPGSDYVVKYDTNTFQELDRAAVGQDPHVSIARQNNLLYVPTQNSNAVFVLDRDTLDPAPGAPIPVPGAHGAGMPRNGKTFYTTNLPGAGLGGLVAIDVADNTVVGDVDTPKPVPHNLALTPNGRKIFITHSGGTAETVSVFTVKGNDPVPTLDDEVTVGLNPFGLAFVP